MDNDKSGNDRNIRRILHGRFMMELKLNIACVRCSIMMRTPRGGMARASLDLAPPQSIMT